MSAKVNKAFASCDSNYFHEHGRNYVMSCLRHGIDVHVHVIDPTDRVTGLLLKYDEYPGFEYSIEENSDAPRDRTYYACNRFLVLPQFMEENPDTNFLITDIDAYFLRPFPFPEEELGLFFREPTEAGNDWERRGMMVAAGIVYVSSEALEFAKVLREKILSYGTGKWFTDQVAIYETYQELYNDKSNVFEFELQHHDWEFHDDSYMWSGKGPRKHNNKRYLEMKESIGK